MHVHERRMPATGHDAAAAVSTHDRATTRGTDRLLGALAHVGRQHLRIAFRHLNDDWIDLHIFTIRWLCARLAALAHRHRDLVARASFVRSPTEHLARHQQEDRIVV